MKEGMIFCPKYFISEAEEISLYEDFILKQHQKKIPLYHYTSIDSLELILKNGTLLFSNLDTFNDPFDMSMNLLDVSLSKEEKYRILTSEKPNISQYASQKDIDIVLESTTVDDIRQVVKPLVSNCGVFCTSRRNDSVLMWSHYAVKHKGVCIQLSFEKTEKSKYTSGMHMVYTDKISPKRFFNDPRSLFYLIHTKSAQWSYEQEVRLAYLDSYGEKPFPKGLISSIYFGVNTTQFDVDKIHGIIKEYGYTETIETTYQMRIKSSEFSLEPVKLKFDVY